MSFNILSIAIGWLIGSFFGIGQLMGFLKGLFPAKPAA